MYRIEIISNKSVEEDITEALEQYVPGILYTTFPLVYGRGGDDYKLGNATWPETNFVMVSYVEDSELDKVKAVIKSVKEKFKSEGVKMFWSQADAM
ncbi:MAG: hypothetical protein ILP07_01320 [Treponema sp.]|nr:hypothetical protein [Treponema sp.]MBQ2081694.1 hypothetical protein [Treponema sp.]MBR6296229.1 hypothetical protein [Treponema sp.]MEE3313519.1 PG0541 family transporter-associated protein [Treponema sp.]